MISDEDVSRRARTLAGALEPVTGQVYFSPECHRAYEALGFGGSPVELGGVAMPDGPAYFCSRGSVMGQVTGEVIAAAFAVFNPAIVVPAVRHGWSITDAATICAARTDGAIAQLRRILGDKPDGLDEATALLERANARLTAAGRPLYAGQVSVGVPDDPIGVVWHLGDRLREYRGDSHTAAWTAAGFDAVEIGLLTELYWGLPLRSYVRSRAWSSDELDEAEARLVDRGLVAEGNFTPAGRAAREAIERDTDRQCRPIVESVGDDVDGLVAILRRWSDAVIAASGYFGSGPHDLAAAASRAN